MTDATSAAAALLRELPEELVDHLAERIAERVAEKLEGHRAVGCELIDAAALARRLGCSRDWIYEHADELGAIRLGDGPKARLRFDVERAITAAALLGGDLRASSEAPAAAPPRRLRRRASGRNHPPSVPLLPIKAERG